MDNAYYQKRRVLVHELGHLVAQTFNHKFFGGEGTEHIRISKVNDINQKNDYVGGTHLKNYDREVVLRHPASLIASSAYGCLFQCIYYGMSLSWCFAPRHSGVHGYTDFEQVHGVLHATGNFAIGTKVLTLIDQHFDKVWNSNEFVRLKEVELDTFINSDEEEFYINPDEILKQLDFFFEMHAEIYKNFVLQLEELLKR